MLQSTVKSTLPVGSAGNIYKAEHSFYTSVQGLVIDDITKVGSFVQAGTKEDEVTMASGVAIATPIIGVVVKEKLRNSAVETDLVEKGNNVTVLTEGYIYIATSLVATQGQYVFLKTADGTLAFGNASTLAGHTYTGFKVDIGNATATAGIIGITSARA